MPYKPGTNFGLHADKSRTSHTLFMNMEVSTNLVYASLAKTIFENYNNLYVFFDINLVVTTQNKKNNNIFKGSRIKKRII